VPKAAVIAVPTRWGHQLNGNGIVAKLDKTDVLVPTRWGHQLNGNVTVNGLPLPSVLWSPLAGDTN